MQAFLSSERVSEVWEHQFASYMLALYMYITSHGGKPCECHHAWQPCVFFNEEVHVSCEGAGNLS